MGLVLRVKYGEVIQIGNVKISTERNQSGFSGVKIHVDAPKDVLILREKLFAEELKTIKKVSGDVK